ncbi:NAD(P)-binding protein [Sarocladium strictum]
MSAFKTVAVLGKGYLGSHVVAELAKQGFVVTVVTRDSSNVTDLPKGVVSTQVDYGSIDSIVNVLEGQDVVISTLSADTIMLQRTIIDAAVKAGALENVPFMAAFGEINGYLAKLAEAGTLEWTQFAIGAFLDYAINYPLFFDAKGRSVRYFNFGSHPFSSTRVETVGRVIALAMTRREATKNRTITIHEALLSQRRLVGISKKLTKGEEWTETYINGEEEYNKQLAIQKSGDMSNVMPMLQAAISTGKFNGAYLTSDNEEFGVTMLTEKDIESKVAGALGLSA